MLSPRPPRVLVRTTEGASYVQRPTGFELAALELMKAQTVHPFARYGEVGAQFLKPQFLFNGSVANPWRPSCADEVVEAWRPCTAVRCFL